MMARRRNSSLGFFGVFGRSEDLRSLDKALRAFDLHPTLVPDAVKLTVLTLLKDARGEDPAPTDYGAVAVLLATARSCALGSRREVRVKGPAESHPARRRRVTCRLARPGHAVPSVTDPRSSSCCSRRRWSSRAISSSTPCSGTSSNRRGSSRVLATGALAGRDPNRTRGASPSS